MHVSVRYLIFAAFNDEIWAKTCCFSKNTQLSMIVHHLAQPESLGVIAWLLHCSSLAACANKHGCFKDSPDCCHEHPNFVPPLCQITCLSASSTCLHTYMHTHCHPFQVEHVWSCLVLLIFSSPQARVLNVCNHACMNMHT